jgi:DNA-binding NtrC family response regulator
VTDVVMPRMGGIELVERLDEIRPAAKVIYMSGHLRGSLAVSKVQEHGVFLQKPFDPSELARTARRLIDAPSVQLLAQAG